MINIFNNNELALKNRQLIQIFYQMSISSHSVFSAMTLIGSIVLSLAIYLITHELKLIIILGVLEITSKILYFGKLYKFRSVNEMYIVLAQETIFQIQLMFCVIGCQWIFHNNGFIIGCFFQCYLEQNVMEIRISSSKDIPSQKVYVQQSSIKQTQVPFLRGCRHLVIIIVYVIWQILACKQFDASILINIFFCATIIATTFQNVSIQYKLRKTDSKKKLENSNQLQISKCDSALSEQHDISICHLQPINKQVSIVYRNHKFKTRFSDQDLKSICNSFQVIEKQQSLWQILTQQILEKSQKDPVLNENIDFTYQTNRTGNQLCPIFHQPSRDSAVEVKLVQSVVVKLCSLILTYFLQQYPLSNQITTRRDKEEDYAPKQFLCQTVNQNKECFCIIQIQQTHNHCVLTFFPSFTLPEYYFQSKYLFFIIQQADKCQNLLKEIYKLRIDKNENQQSFMFVKRRSCNNIRSQLTLIVNYNFNFMDLIMVMPDEREKQFNPVQTIIDLVQLLQCNRQYQNLLTMEIIGNKETQLTCINLQRTTKQLIINIMELFKSVIQEDKSSRKKNLSIDWKLTPASSPTSLVFSFDCEKCQLKPYQIQFLNHTSNSSKEDQMYKLLIHHILQSYKKIGSQLIFQYTDKQSFVVKFQLALNYNTSLTQTQKEAKFIHVTQREKKEYKL